MRQIYVFANDLNPVKIRIGALEYRLQEGKYGRTLSTEIGKVGIELRYEKADFPLVEDVIRHVVETYEDAEVI